MLEADPKDIDVVARTVYGEARGEPNLGKTAVAHVILNRVKHGGWWGNTIQRVCLKKYQFSCWLKDDPNLPKILAVDASDSVFGTCLSIAEDAILGRSCDPTNGADSYLVTGLKTAWTENLVPCAVIGNHSFYRTL